MCYLISISFTLTLMDCSQPWLHIRMVWNTFIIYPYLGSTPPKLKQYFYGYFLKFSSGDPNVQPVLKLLLCRALIRNLGNFATRGYLAISRDISGCHRWGGLEVVLTSSGERQRMLPHILQCIAQPPTRTIQLKMLISRSIKSPATVSILDILLGWVNEWLRNKWTIAIQFTKTGWLRQQCLRTIDQLQIETNLPKLVRSGLS